MSEKKYDYFALPNEDGKIIREFCKATGESPAHFLARIGVGIATGQFTIVPIIKKN